MIYIYRCSSQLGMVGGKQDISIGKTCENKVIVQHEILHALGRIHEQSRTDRHKYVHINWENIKSGNTYLLLHIPSIMSGKGSLCMTLYKQHLRYYRGRCRGSVIG